MIRIIRLLVIVVLLVPTLTYTSGVTRAFAESVSPACGQLDASTQPSSSRSLPMPDVKSITLVEEAELYDEVFTNPTIHAITPQTVKVVERKITYTYNGELKSWYKIQTWLGDKWILSNIAIPSDLKLVTKRITLTAEEKLYEFGTGFTTSKSYLTPQTVKVKAEWQGYYLIDTWLGDRWIAPVHKVLEDTQSMETILRLVGQIELFSVPDEGCSMGMFLEGNTAYAIEKSGDWVHIQVNNDNYWINQKLSLFDTVDAEGYMEAKVVQAEVVGKMTKLTVQARLTDKLKSWSRPLQLTPGFALYDKEGNQLASNLSMGPIEFKANEIQRFVVNVQGDVTQFALATSKIYKINNAILPEGTSAWSGLPIYLPITDVNYSEVRIGEMTVTKQGNNSIVRGKIQVTLANVYDVHAKLTFYNDKEEVIGTTSLKGTYGNTGLSGNTTYRFEAVGQGDFSTYSSVKLSVQSLNGLNP